MRPRKGKVCVESWTSKGWKDNLQIECEQASETALVPAPPAPRPNPFGGFGGLKTPAPKHIIVVGRSEEMEKCMEVPGLKGTETCKPYGSQAGNWIMRPRKGKVCVESWTSKGWKTDLYVECV
mmetsp:Transcript_83026/g.164679  ORF Transcript_83026/g.164679 Transcript_83026/m.164679 type:complete len:123 (-) Transcript_83026:29-397(-)